MRLSFFRSEKKDLQLDFNHLSKLYSKLFKSLRATFDFIEEYTDTILNAKHDIENAISDVIKLIIVDFNDDIDQKQLKERLFYLFGYEIKGGVSAYNEDHGALQSAITKKIFSLVSEIIYEKYPRLRKDDNKNYGDLLQSIVGHELIKKAGVVVDNMASSYSDLCAWIKSMRYKEAFGGRYRRDLIDIHLHQLQNTDGLAGSFKMQLLNLVDYHVCFHFINEGADAISNLTENRFSDYLSKLFLKKFQTACDKEEGHCACCSNGGWRRYATEGEIKLAYLNLSLVGQLDSHNLQDNEAKSGAIKVGEERLGVLTTFR